MSSTETTANAPADGTPAGDVWTVQRILDWTTAHLKKSGSDSPRLDAEILLAHTRGCRRIQLYVQYHEVLTEAQRTRMRDLVKRRSKSEPVAYLVGEKEFFSLPFRVTSDVLIPRPDTETLVADLISQARGRSNPRILDLCTGSGCIAITAARSIKGAQVTAVEISPAALAIARQNAEINKAVAITFVEGDLFAPLEPAARFDFIVSNPPYVADAEMETLPPEIRLHEPALALRAGPDGLDVLRRIVPDAAQWLAPSGLLYLEFSPEQSAALHGLIRESSHYAEPVVLKDAAGKQRVIRVARRD